jgi:hypothetical protein
VQEYLFQDQRQERLKTVSDQFFQDIKARSRSPGETFYTREVAAKYEELRKNDRYWSWENDILDQCLRAFGDLREIADCPVGTGRFMDIYASHNLRVVGIDISTDMLEEAGNKINASGMEGRVQLVEADISNLALREPVAEALVCFRLLHLISDNNLDDVISGLAMIPSRHIILQQFSVKDYNIGRALRRVFHALFSKISLTRKIKYICRTLRDMIVGGLGLRPVSVFSRHKKNTFCDVTYSHSLARVLNAFARRGFIMKCIFDFKDNEHLMGESGSYLSVIIVMEKTK